MRKIGRYCLVGVVLAAAGAVVVGLSILRSKPVRIEAVLTAYQTAGSSGGLKIDYPCDQTLFPPEIVAPTFRWTDDSGADTWVISTNFSDQQDAITSVSSEPNWTAGPKQWELIKKNSSQQDAQVTVIGIKRRRPDAILSAGTVSIRTSSDPVGAPIFYREVNLPFVDAVKDPSLIRWRFGDVSSTEPPIILKGLPVCGNCHSFSREGSTLAMDIDYANSKGSYVITKTSEEITLASSDIITWNDYRKEDGEQTFGLLSQISPDGRYVVSTVKDKSVFVPQPDLAFSQLFFPLKGILCIYDRETQTYTALPGADDPNYVQSNPSWSSDGKYIVFARAKAYDLRNTEGKGKVLLTRAECREFLEEGKLFPFDLYRVPFNAGKGGQAEPIEGASNNGLSNYFAKYSPDGKWIVFCRAKSFMLLQPDSELYIIPAEGGEERRLACNTDCMNSWHSWSPNGKWLVFSSKAYTPYTQLMLTHIDQNGHSTPPVLLSHFTACDRAANIPEFVNVEATAIRKIKEQFLDDYSFVRAGNEFFKAGETEDAIEEYNNALALNPNNAAAHMQLGFLYYNAKQMYEKGFEHYVKAVQLDPNDPRTHYNIGMAFLHQRRLDLAIQHLTEALKRMPRSIDKQYDLGYLHSSLGKAYLHKGSAAEARLHIIEAVQIDPERPDTHYDLALALVLQGHIEQALACYKRAMALDPGVDTSAAFHYALAEHYAQKRDFRTAIACAQRALGLAQRSQDTKLIQTITKSLNIYEQVSRSMR